MGQLSSGGGWLCLQGYSPPSTFFAVFFRRHSSNRPAEDRCICKLGKLRGYQWRLRAMKIKNLIRTVLRGFDSATKVINWVGYISLAGIVLVTTVDVTGRYLFNKPLLGSLEITELTMAVLGGFAMFYTTTQRGHISVDLFFVRFSRRARLIVESFASLLGFGAWGVIAYQVYLLGMRVLRLGESSTLLRIPLSPFQFTFALGLSLYSLTLLIQGLRPLLSEESEKKEGGLGI
jgi:TRAP-type transport system small permease protein